MENEIRIPNEFYKIREHDRQIMPRSESVYLQGVHDAAQIEALKQLIMIQNPGEEHQSAEVKMDWCQETGEVMVRDIHAVLPEKNANWFLSRFEG